ncbi:hypothetical protein SUGI_1050940 [Cryptomeria japonica]|nr:hypothetical protein SUGI_1050940 [Cryptomeria japonica]
MLQRKVVAHLAVGGFLTLESIAEDISLICYSNIELAFAKSLRPSCPRNNSIDNINFSTLDIHGPNILDNNCLKYMLEQKGILHSYQALFSLLNTRIVAFSNAQVTLYRDDQTCFAFFYFEVSVLNMGNIKPLARGNGEIKKFA